jgi:hypothetical protein
VPDLHFRHRHHHRGFAILASALVLAAACGDQGGELKDATDRRRAEMANRDTAKDGTGSVGDTAYSIPTFAGDTPAVSATPPAAPPAKTDSVAKDSSRAPAPAGGEWTLAKRDVVRPRVVGTLRGLRLAQQNGFDRLVLDFGTGPAPGWHVEYVDGPVAQCGSGQVVRVAGDAKLLVRLRTAQAHDDAGAPTVRQRDLSLTLPVMKQLVMTCDFEGDVEIVLGLDSRQPYRVMELQTPNRLVIDLKQP